MSNLGKSFDAAQRAYDAQIPEDDSDYCVEACPDCDGAPAGICELCHSTGVITHHKWYRMGRTAKDGTEFNKCRQCGVEEEA